MSRSEVGRFAAAPKSEPILRVQAGNPNARKLGPLAAAAMVAIVAVDLAAVKQKVVGEKGWGSKIADYAELRYRRFLCMHLLDCELILVPPPDIDTFWHQHILFTRKYAADCDKIFGKFFHHTPSLGADNEVERLQRGFVATSEFYADTFGESYLAVSPEGVAASWLELFA